MAQQMPMTSERIPIELDTRLSALDEVDRKIGEIIEATKDCIGNLEKDKQISKSKMDESVRRFTKSLEEDILKVINDQLDYMEQLCVGSEHQGSMFGIQNRRENGRQTLQNLHKELDAMVPAKEEPDPDIKMEGAVSEDDKDDGSFEDVVMSGGSDA